MQLLLTMSSIVAEAGLGKDIWTIPFDKITFILLIYFIDEPIYITVVSLTKISILCFYLRIFPDRNFRRAVYAVMVFTGLYMLAFILVSLFQCRPVDHAWKYWNHEHAGACNNVNAQGWAAAIFNIVLDIATIILPLRQLSKLAMNWKKKVQLMLMFGFGGFVTLVSILRLETLIYFAKSENFTWDVAPFGYWSTIEMDIGVMCACMPALHSLFKRIWPKVFGGTARDKLTGRSGTSGLSASLGADRSQRSHKNTDTKDFIPLMDVNSTEAQKEGSKRNDV
ncbi:uncharacterized protein N0V89_009158 [Didymosphaeria variabile]|uniref:Rhodopsin domain-containing protein n=1 Tax=Didymosphaeria variabile TaxID=1932322 RepID=A0A9W9C6Z4_9PLEO|nr:uncharacterized protein N0V89_009158 [Didymosphaeria variabile]KAJ4347788.1 hypothetical protein N0V89_009158 [Didymosphaeria variabile]